ncbi:hypothetical protein [Thalassobius sp. I31.1]|uniref:hypothetical protein n=1 Tax=Thalassobius sp. I31.1 TaxID=2109912 RepID=UPI000D1B49D3|nr:hypothetical protein [Thalassobius sp. I31.1]
MIFITGTAGDDIILIDNNVITVNGVLFTDPLTRISLSSGTNDQIIIKDSTISPELISMGSGHSLEIINSDVTIASAPSDPTAGLRIFSDI